MSINSVFFQTIFYLEGERIGVSEAAKSTHGRGLGEPDRFAASD